MSSERSEHGPYRSRTWQQKIFNADDFKCRMPGCPGTCLVLQAHHIKRFKDFPELRLEVTNGITLCKDCHDSIKNKEDEYEVTFAKIVEQRPKSETSSMFMDLLRKRYTRLMENLK